MSHTVKNRLESILQVYSSLYTASLFTSTDLTLIEPVSDKVYKLNSSYKIQNALIIFIAYILSPSKKCTNCNANINYNRTQAAINLKKRTTCKCPVPVDED